MEITNYLTKLRKDSNISQLEISKKSNIEQSRLSRIERGEIEPNEGEITSYLDALSSNEAYEVLTFLKQNFMHTEKPKLDHPQRSLLIKVENFLKEVTEFSLKVNIPELFQTQLQNYKTQLIALSGFILKLEHNITFIGDIGCGKTTAICSLLNLFLPKSEKNNILSKITVLATGSGRTTLCEVILTAAENYGISVESYTEAEIIFLVDEFCKQLKVDYPNDDSNTNKIEGRLITDEIDRVIRNMAGLSKKSEKSKDGRYKVYDPAKELLLKYNDIDKLRQITLSQMKLKERTYKTIWSPEKNSDTSLEWLQKIFSEINSGRHINFSLPKSITVFLPKKILLDDDIVVNIIDSKGIDETSIRPDIKKHIENPRTLTIFCTRFNNAPSVPIQELIKHRKELGDEISLENKSIMLILPQNNEAIQTKLPDGSSNVESEIEGYEIKKDQVEEILNGLKIKITPIIVFNSISDNLGLFKKEIQQKLTNYREIYVKKINDIILWSEELIESYSEEQLLLAQKKVLKHLIIWCEENANISLNETHIHKLLLSQIQLSHVQTIRATNYRAGYWQNLDYYQLIGEGSRINTLSFLNEKIYELKGILKVLRRDDEYKWAFNFIDSLLNELDTNIEQFLSAVESSTLNTFSFPLQADNNLWQTCISRWGKGPNYREDIKQWIKEWFENELKEDLHNLVNQAIQEHWENHIIKMFNKYFKDQSL